MVAGIPAANPGSMNESYEIVRPIRPGSVVVGVDGSSHADQALAWAAGEARLTHRPLSIVYAEKPLGSQERGWLAQAGIPLTQVTQEIRQDSAEIVDRATEAAALAAPEVEIDGFVRVGDPRQILLDLAKEAGMVVLGSRGRGPVSSLLLGSVSVAVSRHATCPVVVLRPRQDLARLHGVMVATDAGSRSTATLEAAFREASYRELPLTVVHCQWEALSAPGGWRAARPDDPFYDAARVRVAEAISGLREKFPDVTVTRGIFAGHVDQCVSDLSREHDLTVIGRHDHSMWERFSSLPLTTAVLEHACGPVLIVP
jgi:nucleotide-binding universal stress UspA family protein